MLASNFHSVHKEPVVPGTVAENVQIHPPLSYPWGRLTPIQFIKLPTRKKTDNNSSLPPHTPLMPLQHQKPLQNPLIRLAIQHIEHDLGRITPALQRARQIRHRAHHRLERRALRLRHPLRRPDPEHVPAPHAGVEPLLREGLAVGQAGARDHAFVHGGEDGCEGDPRRGYARDLDVVEGAGLRWCGGGGGGVEAREGNGGLCGWRSRGAPPPPSSLPRRHSGIIGTIPLLLLLSPLGHPTTTTTGTARDIHPRNDDGFDRPCHCHPRAPTDAPIPPPRHRDRSRIIIPVYDTAHNPRRAATTSHIHDKHAGPVIALVELGDGAEPERPHGVPDLERAGGLLGVALDLDGERAGPLEARRRGRGVAEGRERVEPVAGEEEHGQEREAGLGGEGDFAAEREVGGCGGRGGEVVGGGVGGGGGGGGDGDGSLKKGEEEEWGGIEEEHFVGRMLRMNK